MAISEKSNMTDSKIEKLYLNQIAFKPALDVQRYHVLSLKNQIQTEDLSSNQNLTAAPISDELASTNKIANKNTRAFLLGLEHPNTVSMGRRFMLLDQDSLQQQFSYFKNKNYEIEASERGGFITLHQPGQLVVYPIVHLPSFRISLKCFIRLLADACIELCQVYGIPAYYDEKDPGVYVDQAKIASIGVRLVHSISSHGIAINIFNDLSDFSQISICGKDQRPMSSFKSYFEQNKLAVKPDKQKSIFNLEQIFDSYAQILSHRLSQWSSSDSNVCTND